MRSNPEKPLPPRLGWILAGITLFSVGFYLVLSGVIYHLGFPLDDAWIHQTYARNLALHGEWSFIPGKPSGGSTSPLWSALLAIGFWLKLSPYLWTYLLGAVVFWKLAILSESASRKLVSSYQPKFPWVGTAMALEWHLVWASVSGMETILFALLATSTLVLLISRTQEYSKVGLLIGLSMWVRPDGITLLGPAVVAILLIQPTWSRRLRGLVNLGIPFGIFCSLYILFNFIVSGSPLPNTFYAKQAEYAQYLELPFINRFGGQVLPLLTGMGIILLPGFILTLLSAFQHRNWGMLAAAAWFSGYMVIYAWRLPVSYQYGRYIMPAMPIIFLLGLIGLIEFTSVHAPHWRWITAMSWRFALGGVIGVFWVLGSSHYARDVAFIESEMVATAKWVSSNVPPQALVAAHDIGALGYFGNHDLVDLAGLVSPEVIHFLRDEKRIAEYLTERGVTILVTFPDWYPALTSDLSPIYPVGANIDSMLGSENMAVYQWPEP